MLKATANQDPDVLICGGSLAGLACAIRLKQLGIDALVLEQSEFPREKLCGEFLGPDAIACLQSLDLWQFVRPKAYGPIEWIRVYNRRGKALNIQPRWIRNDFPYGFAIPRAQLDAILLTIAQKMGITVVEKSRVTACKKNGNGFYVSAERDGEQVFYQCAFFVDASGRNTGFYRQTGIVKSVGLQFHVQLPQEHADAGLDMFLFKGGYGGIQQNAADRANVCVLIQPELAKLAHGDFKRILAGTLHKNPAAREILEGSTLAGKIRSTSVPNLNPTREKTDLLHIGDAMITVEPFTGFGMAHALSTGSLGAMHLAQGLLKGRSYQSVKDGYYQEYQQHFGRYFKFVRFMRPALESAWVQRLCWPVLPPFLPLLSKMYR